MALGEGDDLDVLVLNTGRVYLDILFGDASRLPEPGEEIHYDSFSIQAGGAFNAAAGMAKLGLRTAIVADLGTDPFSDFLFEEIQKAGLVTDFVQRVPGPVPAVTVALSDRRDRRFLSHIRPMEDTRLDPVVFRERRIRHIHMPGYRHAGVVMTDIVRAAHAAGIALSLDSQSDVLSFSAPPLADLAPLLAFLFCNRREAAKLTGEDDPERAARILARYVRCPVVKLGEQGALAIVDGALVRAPGLAVSAVDTTGAGDSFAAGFLFGILQGMGVAKALAVGNICGALSTTRLGAFASFPDRAQVEAHLAGRG